MSISDALLPEYDHEMATTRRVLERLPEDKFEWKAHPKSNSIGWNVAHLAEIPGWVEGTMTTPEWDIGPEYQTYFPPTREDALRVFDENVAVGRKALAAATDENFAVAWSLKAGGRTIFTLPRAAVIRTFILSHMIHHRAIVTVYMRLNDIPVPSIYGPSGDEQNPQG